MGDWGTGSSLTFRFELWLYDAAKDRSADLDAVTETFTSSTKEPAD